MDTLKKIEENDQEFIFQNQHSCDFQADNNDSFGIDLKEFKENEIKKNIYFSEIVK